MDTIFRGDLTTRRGRMLAWADALLVDHGLLRLGWWNFAAVVPGQLYRSNHPSPGRLAVLVPRLGLRTVINLRGQCGNGSDALSREEAARLKVSFIDAPLQSGRPPPRERALVLAEALATAPRPILVHCKSGADRAGFAAGMFLLLQGGSSADALGQLSLRFGHLRHSRAGVLDAFFLRFAAEAEGRKPFLDWLRDDYDPASLRRNLVARAAATFLNDRLLLRE